MYVNITDKALILGQKFESETSLFAKAVVYSLIYSAM